MLVQASQWPDMSGRCQLHAKQTSARKALAALSLLWHTPPALVLTSISKEPSTCTGGLSKVWASMRARALRNASQAEQSTPPEGTMIELFPLGLQQEERLSAACKHLCHGHLCANIVAAFNHSPRPALRDPEVPPPWIVANGPVEHLALHWELLRCCKPAKAMTPRRCTPTWPSVLQQSVHNY